MYRGVFVAVNRFLRARATQTWRSRAIRNPRYVGRYPLTILFTNKFPPQRERDEIPFLLSPFVSRAHREPSSCPLGFTLLSTPPAPAPSVTSVDNAEKVPWPRKDCWSSQRGNSDKRQSARRKLHPRSRPALDQQPHPIVVYSELHSYHLSLSPFLPSPFSLHELPSGAKRESTLVETACFGHKKKWFSSPARGRLEGIRNERTLTRRTRLRTKRIENVFVFESSFTARRHPRKENMHYNFLYVMHKASGIRLTRFN